MAGRIEAQFSALSGLAAIDNDILAGAPIQQVADRILRQAASQCPGCRVAISWLDASGDLNTAATVSTAEQDTAATRADRAPTGGWRREPLPAAARSRFAALAADTWYQAGSDELQSDPWLAWAAPGAATLAVLPVREQGRTQALICLAAAQPVPAAVLRPLRELRDRLAVAFAAWSRERELAYRATHDSLTGLANRSGLQEFLDAALAAVVSAAKAVNAGPEQPGASPARAFPAGAAADAASVGLALLFIDLDRFKDINDVLGHDAGDELLCLAAERLLRGMPPGSLLSRPGGDEFVAVLPAFDEARAAALAALLVQGLAQPFALRGAARTIGASIGIAVAPAHGHERDTLMRRADAAMYAAKEGGRGRAMVFSADMDVRARDRLRVQSELPRAIANGEIAAWFQPRVRPSDLAITSAEALVRWQHPALGLLKPAAFIGFAEDSELIVQLGDRMLDQSLAQMARWRALGSGIGRISVNISTRQLAEGRLLDKVGAALERHGVPAHCLELEVTESVMAGDGDNFASQLAQLRALGTTIAMDDFGTGYSSMANLRNLPIDVMKIDRAFVKDLDKSGAERQGALAVIRAIVAMAKSMQLSLVAEGIETAAQAEVLRALDCEEFQGFLYAPPLPAAEFEAMLRAGVALRRAG
jgi:diguanylate cyclase (GGDEF)-like protein